MNWEYQTVAIDFSVHKALTARLESETDTPNNVIRRLLGLGEPTRSVTSDAHGREWIVGGVSFPEGTEFRAQYKHSLYTGTIQRGTLVVKGQGYASPSAAAIAITRNSVNGWKFWEARRPGQARWVLIDTLRRHGE